MLRRILICQFFVLWALSLSGQILNGIVVDSKKNPIESASIMIKRLEDSAVINYVSSDKVGRFAIQTKTNETKVFLQISHLNYDKLIIPLKDSIFKSVDFYVLTEKHTNLNEVIISSKIPIRIKNDSTIYNLSRFGNGSEENLEELLRKLPNFRIDSNGDIFYKNKPIEKIFLDGEDIIGNNQNLATKSINPNVLKELQAVENFSENILLKGLENSEKVIINLTVKEERKSLIFGNLDMGLGPKNINSLINLFSYSKNFKAFNINSFNNVGVQRNTFTKFNKTNISLVEQNNTSFVSINQPIFRFYNSQLENINSEKVFTLNFVNTLKKDFKFTTNFTLIKDNNTQTKSQFINFFNDNVVFKQTDTIKFIPSNLNLVLKLEKKFRNNINSTWRGIFDLKNNKYNQFFWFNNVANSTSDSRNNFINSLLNIQNELSFTKRKNKNTALSLNLFLNSNKIVEDQRITNFIDFGILKDDSLFTNGIVTQNQQQNIANLGSLIKLNFAKKNYTIEESFGIKKTYYLSAINQKENNSSDYNYYENTLFNRESLISNHLFSYKVKSLNLKVISDIEFAHNNLNSSKRYYLFYKLNATSQYNLNQYNSLGFSLDIREIPVSNPAFHNSKLITDYRTGQFGQKKLLVERQNSLYLSYNFNDVFDKRLNFSVVYYLVNNINSWGFNNLKISSNYSLMGLDNTYKNDVNGIDIRLEKLIFSLSGNFKATFKLLNNSVNQIINTSSVESKISSLNTSIWYTSSFKGFFNTEFGFEQNVNSLTNISVQSNKSNFIYYKPFLKGVVKFQNFEFNTNFEDLVIQNRNNLLLTVNSTYSFNRRSKLKINVTNLFNCTEVKSFHFNSISASESSIPLIGRAFLLHFIHTI